MQIRGASRNLILVAVLAVVAGIGVGSWLLLREGGETWTRDRCGEAAVEFAVEEEQDGLEVSYELQALAPSEVWTVSIERDGTSLLRGERTTDEDAELEVDVFVHETGGADFTATATPPDGEPCSIELRHG